jgi:hypothetical protein
MLLATQRMRSLNVRHDRRKAVSVFGAAGAAVVLAACGTIVAPTSKTSAPRSARETASVIKWTSSSGSPRTAAARQALGAVNAAFARAEDTYEAMFAPPPAPGTSISALQDNMAIAPRPMLDSTGRHAYLSGADQATIKHRGMVALLQVFTPAIVQREYDILAGVVGTQSSGQDLLGGGGASVVRYLAESINGSQASIRAAVKQWNRIGYVNPISGKQHWQVNRAIVLVDVTLVRSQRGSWLVASRSWNYAPGQGP